MVYISVHDLVWMNSLVAGQGVCYDYERLEAGIAAQYGYGGSRDARGQAAAFIEALTTSPPFSCGSVRTAMLAASVFLECNGVPLRAPIATVGSQMLRLVEGTLDGAGFVGAVAGEQQEPADDLQVRPTTVRLCAELREALHALDDRDVATTHLNASEALHRD